MLFSILNINATTKPPAFGATILSHAKGFLEWVINELPAYSSKPGLVPVVKPAFIVRDSTFQNRYSAKR
jgi:hypothetical protein